MWDVLEGGIPATSYTLECVPSEVDGQAIRSVHDGHVGIRWVLVVDGEPTSSLTGSLWVWVWVWV